MIFKSMFLMLKLSSILSKFTTRGENSTSLYFKWYSGRVHRSSMLSFPLVLSENLRQCADLSVQAHRDNSARTSCWGHRTVRLDQLCHENWNKVMRWVYLSRFLKAEHVSHQICCAVWRIWEKLSCMVMCNSPGEAVWCYLIILMKSVDLYSFLRTCF